MHERVNLVLLKEAEKTLSSVLHLKTYPIRSQYTLSLTFENVKKLLGNVKDSIHK